MAEAKTQVPVKTGEKAAEGVPALSAWRPMETLRREIDRLFEDFNRDFWRIPFRRPIFDIEPFWRRELAWGAAPAVDIVEKDDAYEIVAELPGLDAENVEVNLADGGLTIKGQKQEEKEEKGKAHYLRERRFGAFERRFHVPDDVDADKIEASFKKGVLTVTLPKKPEAKRPEKKIKVKTS
jgi:HSP20 family protein